MAWFGKHLDERTPVSGMPIYEPSEKGFIDFRDAFFESVNMYAPRFGFKPKIVTRSNFSFVDDPRWRSGASVYCFGDFSLSRLADVFTPAIILECACDGSEYSLRTRRCELRGRTGIVSDVIVSISSKYNLPISRMAEHVTGGLISQFPERKIRFYD